MTTIITRLYEAQSTVDAVVSELKEAGYTDRTLTVISGGDDLTARMEAAQVPAEAMAAYAPLIEGGNTLVAVKGMIGKAQRAANIADRHPKVDAGLANENVYIPTRSSGRRKRSSHSDHRLVATPAGQRAVFNGTKRYGDAIMPLLRTTKREISCFQGTKRFGDFAVPLLTNSQSRDISVFQGTKRFGAFIMPLLSKSRSRDRSVYHGTKRFGDFLMPLLSDSK